MVRASEFEEVATAESRYGKIILRTTGKRTILNSYDAYHLAMELILAMEETDPDFVKETLASHEEGKLHKVLGMR